MLWHHAAGRYDEREKALTIGELQEVMRLMTKALQSARETQRYAAATVGADRSGGALDTNTKAKETVQDLERLERQLQAVRPT